MKRMPLVTHAIIHPKIVFRVPSPFGYLDIYIVDVIGGRGTAGPDGGLSQPP